MKGEVYGKKQKNSVIDNDIHNHFFSIGNR